jgi:hypothetical protein
MKKTATTLLSIIAILSSISVSSATAEPQSLTVTAFVTDLYGRGFRAGKFLGQCDLQFQSGWISMGL